MLRRFRLEIQRFEEVRSASALTIVAVILASITWLLLLWAYLLSSTVIEAIEESTSGLVQFTLIVSLISLAISLSIIVVLGRLRPRDVGLRGAQIVAGVVLVAVLWMCAHVMLAGVAIATGHGLALSPVDPSVTGTFIAQLCGNALKEETVFRGFLLVQLALLARRWTTPRIAWVVAVVVSQLVFALFHVPHRWVMLDMHGAPLLENLAFLWWYGVVYAVIYLRTSNLGVCIALHSISNIPVTFVESPMHLGLAMNILTFAILVAWPRLVRRFPSLGWRD